MLNTKIEEAAVNAVTSKKSKFSKDAEHLATMKKVFLLLFLISLLLTIFFITDNKANYFYAITIHLGLAFISLFFLFKKDIRTTISNLGIPFDLLRLAKYIVIGLGVIFLVSIIISQVMMHFGLWDQEKVRERITDMPWYILVLAVTIVPISEELFFRGLLVSKVGIIPASILFSIAHFTYGSWAEISVTLFIGLWFGYIYKKSKSILPTMAIHFIYNLLSISIMILATRAGLV